MNIVVEGCAHGELDRIYESIGHLQEKHNIKVDVLLCCGDFQAVRNEIDMNSLSVPAKYRSMNSFYKYYSGERQAPVLTLFIGGNHEASNHLRELYYGGWVAPNIYYLGTSGVVNFNGLRIGGLSGIYKSYDYRSGYFERAPYREKSVYHVRQFDVLKLQQLRTDPPLDVLLSHDWPKGVERAGDTAALLRRKPFFRDEVAQQRFGSGPGDLLMRSLRPRYWFAAHLHVKFAAVVQHPPSVVPNTPRVTNDPATSSSSSSSASVQPAPLLPGPVTKFLALDKVLPHRDFLQVIRIEPLPHRVTQMGQDNGSSRGGLCYDLEWLAIVRLTHAHVSWTLNGPQMPSISEEALNREMEWLQQRLPPDALRIPRNFSITVTPFRSTPIANEIHGRNPQTAQFLHMLGLVDHAPSASEGSAAAQIDDLVQLNANPDEIQLAEEEIATPAESAVKNVESEIELQDNAASDSSCDDNDDDDDNDEGEDR